ncbi:hypothetical protein CEP52_008461 [Fusarium oligoseptatum]|uniref:Uncharacterized protein n=1 Tax=Fusarium oligoseptatum TaxID=2604345 RepID=A0A428THL3_9HYPO|nr:hypothetical protein CEP52_008461 [Fusarium oligoseptatum]
MIRFELCSRSSSELSKSLSKEDKSRYWRKIAKKNVKLETSLAPAHTATCTRTIRATSIVVITLQPTAVTKKVTQMTTETGAPVTPLTITVTKTDIDVEMITEADTTHATNFVTVTETETETEVATEIKLITETKTHTDPWSPSECDERRVIGSKRELRQKRAQIPAKCFTKPAVTLTIFKITLKRPTVMRTVTLTRYAPGTTVSAPKTTETITEHGTQTDHTLVTDVFTETETEMTTTVTTETETEWVVQTASACSNIEVLRKPGSLSNPTVFFKKFENPSLTESELTMACCDTCFASPDCAYFRVAWPHCETYGTHSKIVNSCYPA